MRKEAGGVQPYSPYGKPNPADFGATKIANQLKELAVRKIILIACFVASGCGMTASDSAVESAGTDTGTARLQGRIGGTTLLSSNVQGMNRICTYRAAAVGTEVRTYRVGLGERCPETYPTTDRNFPVPPTARLESSEMGDEGRDCVYAQGASRWTITIARDGICPLSAGMATSNSQGG